MAEAEKDARDIVTLTGRLKPVLAQTRMEGLHSLFRLGVAGPVNHRAACLDACLGARHYIA
jgi:hypothetical protein